MNKQFKSLCYIVPGCLLAAISLLMLCVPELKLPVFSAPIATQKQNIQALLTSISQAAAENRKLMQETQAMAPIRKSAFQPQEGSDPVICFRERLESAGKTAAVKIKAIGDIQRRDTTSEELKLLEVSFSAEGQFENFLAFAEELWSNQPRIYWKTLTVKPVINQNTDTLAFNAVVSMFLFGSDHEE